MSNPSGVSAEKLPRHIAIIMDGNGRWARERGLPRIEGHRRGSQSVRACTAACVEAGVPYLTLYAFSKENWQRPADEVTALVQAAIAEAGATTRKDMGAVMKIVNEKAAGRADGRTLSAEVQKHLAA